MEAFKASTRDWLGSVAGDSIAIGGASNQNDFRLYLTEKGLLQDAEYLAGMKVVANIPCRQFKDFTVIYFIANRESEEREKADGAVQMRRFEEDMSPQEFFDRFKQFQFTLSPKGAMENAQFCVRWE